MQLNMIEEIYKKKSSLLKIKTIFLHSINCTQLIRIFSNIRKRKSATMTCSGLKLLFDFEIILKNKKNHKTTQYPLKRPKYTFNRKRIGNMQMPMQGPEDEYQCISLSYTKYFNIKQNVVWNNIARTQTYSFSKKSLSSVHI